MQKIKVTIWNEFRHEKNIPAVAEIYPEGLHVAIGKGIAAEDLEIRYASLDEPEHGLTDEVLANTDVLLWWGHMAHGEVNDELVKKIQTRVYLGKMGFIALHSAHYSKPFRKLIGTSGNLSWGRDQKEIMWNLLPAHPIAAGIPDHFIIEKEELYCEPFYIPQPDELVFGAWYEDGFIFRSGLCYYRGAGKVFYFQPGHEFCRSFYNPYVQRVICNAVKWAAPNEIVYPITNDCPHVGYKLTDKF